MPGTAGKGVKFFDKSVTRFNQKTRELRERLPDFRRSLEWFMKYRPELAALVAHWMEPGHSNRRLLSLLRPDRMRHLLWRMLDESEFLYPFGVRSLSRAHRDQLYLIVLDSHLVSIFRRDGQGGRRFHGISDKQDSDPHFRDHLLFYEYFHGDSGCGMGASHQTGWTGLVAKLLQPRR